MFDTLQDGVLILNAEGKIRYCNNALSSLLNIPIRRLKIDTELSSYVSFDPPLFKEGDQDALFKITESTPYREIKFLSKSGRDGQVQVSIQPSVDTPFSGEETAPASELLWIVYFRDVTLESTLHSKYLSELDKKEHVILKLEEAQKKLKEYSETLEKKVEQRTVDLANSNKMLTAMINSLGQAFVVVDRDGICSKTYSRVTLKLLEADPSLKPLASVLKIPQSDKSTFQNWLKLLLEERLPFEELVNLGPKTFSHSNGRHISLEFHPVREADRRLSGIVVVATDKTGEIMAIKQAEQEQIFAKRVIKLAKYKDLFWNFVNGAESTLAALRRCLSDPATSVENLDKILRSAHTLKGESSLFWVSALTQDMHEFEILMKELATQPKSLWAATAVTAQLMLTETEKHLQDFLIENAPIVGEQKSANQKFLDLPYDKLQNFFEKLHFQKDLAQEFEDEFLKEPVIKYFRQYDDLVATIATKCGKTVNPVVLKGAETRILAVDYENILNSFIHVFSNSVDHGIELPEVRFQRNKPTAGTISIDVSETPSEYKIIVEDDGGGIDPGVIREKLASQGRTGFENESDAEVIQHIFDPNFSTKQSLSTVSGQGVGLNALASAVTDAGGKIEVQSKIEVGTQVIISLPKKIHLKAA